MDRGRFSVWSLELGDAEFAQALAAAGALAALNPITLSALNIADEEEVVAALLRQWGDTQGQIPWRLPSALARGRIQLPGRKVAPSAKMLATAWHSLLSTLGSVDAPESGLAAGPVRIRLAIRLQPRGSLAAVMELLPVLGHQSTHCGTVFVEDAFAVAGPVDWRWPFAIATLPNDPLGNALIDLQERRADWPIQFSVAGRNTARLEVLVISLPLAEALAILLASRLKLRCALVVVAGLGDVSVARTEPLLIALQSLLSADGVAVVQDSQDVPIQYLVNNFAFELTHNRPIDIALVGAFGRGTTLLLSRDLLQVSRLDHALEHVTRKLRSMPDAATVQLSDRSLQTFRVPIDLGVGGSRGGSVPSFEIGAGAMADAVDSARDSYTFSNESSEASAVSEILRVTAGGERSHRYLRQETLHKVDGQLVEVHGDYALSRPLLVRVIIGPLREGSVSAPRPFPEQELPKYPTGHRLQVSFYESRQMDAPMLREIMLPPVGDSTPAEFSFTPTRAGAFEARISVLHRGRVMQTLLLRTAVTDASGRRGDDEQRIRLEEAIHVRQNWSNLGQRRHFDMALVLNHSADGESILTGVAGKRAWAMNLEGMKTPVRRINDLISNVANSAADYGDGLEKGKNPELLVQLARVGRDLYARLYRDQLKVLTTGGLDVGDESVTHLQIVSTQADSIVPLEFLYDYNAPKPNASVCTSHREALETGQCPANCARAQDPGGFVCPLGFWGVKKVIERHMYDATAISKNGVEFVVQSESSEGRDVLNIGSGALVGHSVEVKPVELKPLLANLSRAIGAQVPVVKDWSDWRSIVGSERPNLLIAFPHNEGQDEDMVLEIGGDKLDTLDLPPTYVTVTDGGQPVVFLLGCDVAGTAQDFSNHIGRFRQAGAAVVVSTIATVFGAHAVRVGDAILSRLMKADVGGAKTIGDVMRDAKRASLLASVPMALCVVAFGDADWRLSDGDSK